jgi:uncharacterized glyoxalase superfamily protein PhnB/catechol 2,3-dioxygenase-like lactoylglutathione lyase family enzyme
METVNFRYIVDDVDAAVAFYEQLKFRVTAHPAPGFAALDRDGVQLFLNAPGAGGAGQTLADGAKPEPGGWNRIQLAVDDLDAALSELRQAGVDARSDIIEGKGGRQFLLRDPSGNLVEVFEARQRDTVKRIPAGYHTVTPFFSVEDVGAFIQFLQAAFGAVLNHSMKSDDGVIRHATVRIGDSLLMISSGTEQHPSRPLAMHLYVEDVDALFERATKAGARSLEAPTDQFYGDRRGGLEDSWGNHWWIATHREDLDAKTLRQRELAFRRNQSSDRG